MSTSKLSPVWTLVTILLISIIAIGGTVAWSRYSPSQPIEISMPSGEEGQWQKININRAELWLLKTLPGIGEVRAQAIIDYCEQNEPFNNIDEITEVKGIGTITYEKIKHLITVAD